jgi:hypothetical protein
MDYQSNKYKDFKLRRIASNAHRRNDTQGVTGSSPVRPTKVFQSFAGLSLVFRPVRGISKLDFSNYFSN